MKLQIYYTARNFILKIVIPINKYCISMIFQYQSKMKIIVLNSISWWAFESRYKVTVKEILSLIYLHIKVHSCIHSCIMHWPASEHFMQCFIIENALLIYNAVHKYSKISQKSKNFFFLYLYLPIQFNSILTLGYILKT